MPSTSADELESKLAGFVRSYIRASTAGDSGQEEALRWVCVGLEFLLAELLDSSDGWSGWIDGIVPSTGILQNSVTVSSTLELSVRGCAIWLKVPRGCWIEPFFGSVEISEASDNIVTYDLRFADSARELGSTPYGTHLRRQDWFHPVEWKFRFSKIADTSKTS